MTVPRRSLWLAVVGAAAALGAGGSDAADGVLHIGNSTQLFVDNFLVASTNLSRTMNRPAADRVVIAADAPWERGFKIGIIGTSVVQDGGLL